MKLKRSRNYIIILFFLMSNIVYSHGIKNGPPHPRPNGPGPYPELPIDGFTSILLITGAFFGAYKLKRK